MTAPTIGSLCSGYGGLDMAVEAVFGAHTVWHAENDPAPSRVLEARWPGAPNLGDLTAVDWTLVEPVDLITAGYPCPPFSYAGKRKGTDDERHLWPYVAAAIRGVRPRLVVLENVAGHRTLGFDTVLGDLAALGYDVRWTSLRAADVGAPHRRERLFIVAADAADLGHERGGRARDGRAGSSDRRGSAPDAASGPRRVGHGDDVLTGRGTVGRESAAGRGTTAHVESAERRGAQPEHLGARPERAPEPRERTSTDWAAYEPAIRRWERRLGRDAPSPTEPGARGGQRLSPRFVEWMMGLPAGWVTDVDGLSRNDQLKILGNGVVPQQAEHALRTMLAREAAA